MKQIRITTISNFFCKTNFWLTAVNIPNVVSATGCRKWQSSMQILFQKQPNCRGWLVMTLSGRCVHSAAAGNTPMDRASIRSNCDFNGEAKVAIHLPSLSCCLFLHPHISSLIELAVRNQVKGKGITRTGFGKLGAVSGRRFDLKSSLALWELISYFCIYSKILVTIMGPWIHFLGPFLYAIHSLKNLLALKIFIWFVCFCILKLISVRFVGLIAVELHLNYIFLINFVFQTE